MTPAGEGFPKAARIRRRREYLALGRTGERCHAAHFVVVLQPRAGASRLGVTVSRKVGGAVVRNRLRRRVRETFRRHPDRLLPSCDLIVIAKAGAGGLSASAVRRELTTALARRASGPRTRRA